MERAALVHAIVSNQARLFSGHLHASTNRGQGFRVAHVRGVTCFSSTGLAMALFNRALPLAATDIDRAVLERVARHYERLERPAVLEVPDLWLNSRARRELASAGFREDGPGAVTHVLRDVRRTPAAPRIARFEVRRQDRDASSRYARLATRGFGGGASAISRVFERGWTELLRDAPRTAVAFVGLLGGEPAATGVLLLAFRVGGLFSGSVLPSYRGRGIQAVMIAARIGYGFDRGLRDFFSQTEDEHTPSAHNLRDLGFRPLFGAVRFVRGCGDRFDRNATGARSRR